MKLQFCSSAAVVLTALIAMVGCASPPRNADQAAATAVAASMPPSPVDWTAIDQRLGPVSAGWIAAYEDPQLVGLVAEAQSNNRDIEALATSIDRAWALANQAGAAAQPQLSGVAGTTAQGRGEGQGQGSGSLGLQASWEVDVWGRIRSGENAAVASAKAAEADVRFARQSLAASVATAYFIAVEAARQERLAQETLDSISEILRITTVRAENGLATNQDLALARADAATAEERLSAVRGSKRDALRALEVLLGRYPSADIETVAVLPVVPAMPPAGLPSELLSRRPDLVAAERQIAATVSGVNQAEAAKLPNISLTATASGASDQLNSLLDPTNLAWQAASSLLVPILDGGRLDAQVDIATADEQAAVASYAQAALNAFQDVETTLDAYSVLEERRTFLQSAVSDSAEALRLARLRYDEGETDLLDVLSVQQRLNSNESGLISVQREQLTNYAALNLALGGDWSEAT